LDTQRWIGMFCPESWISANNRHQLLTNSASFPYSLHSITFDCGAGEQVKYPRTASRWIKAKLFSGCFDHFKLNNFV